MLAEVISFGGRVRDRSKILERWEIMRLKAQSDKKTVLVQIKTKQRDNAEKVAELNKATGEPTGKMVDNPRFGKFFYVGEESLELEDANPKEVFAIVKEAIIRASKK